MRLPSTPSTHDPLRTHRPPGLYDSPRPCARQLADRSATGTVSPVGFWDRARELDDRDLPAAWRWRRDNLLPTSPRGRAVVAAFVAVSVVTWMTTMASAPRYSYGPKEDMGHGAVLVLVLVGAALIGGVLLPERPLMIGLALGLPSLALSPWTAPRGDNDGLWALVIPFMALLVPVLCVVAAVGAIARLLVRRVRAP